MENEKKDLTLDGVTEEDIKNILNETPDENGKKTEEKIDEKKSVEDPEIDLGESFGKMKLSDIKKGIMLQKDYTQKTQILAKDRDLLEKYSTLDKFLQEHPEQQEAIEKILQGKETKQEEEELDAEIDDPKVAKQIKELREKVESLVGFQTSTSKEKAKTDLETKISEVKSYAKENFPTIEINEGELCAEALKMGTTDLKSAFRNLYFDKIIETTKGKVVTDIKTNQNLKVNNSETKVTENKKEPIVVTNFDQAEEEANKMIKEN